MLVLAGHGGAAEVTAAVCAQHLLYNRGDEPMCRHPCNISQRINGRSDKKEARDARSAIRLNPKR